jgi:ribosomal protein L11 methyltransferase
MNKDSGQSVWEAKAIIPTKHAEFVNDILLEMGDERWTLYEDVVAGTAWIAGIFESAEDAGARWSELSAQLASMATGEIVIRQLPPHEWRDSYKLHFRPWKFGPLHWVPIWERDTYSVPGSESVLWLDPGLAFGTGNHETTRLCVERLVECATTKDKLSSHVIDAGCGSGILALSAAKLGFASVEGFDNDSEAVRVSIENAALNDLDPAVRFSRGDLISGLEHKKADVVVANILADVLIRHAEQLTGAVAPGGWLILSGILSTERDAVREAFGEVVPGWEQRSRTLGDWSDVLLLRP